MSTIARPEFRQFLSAVTLVGLCLSLSQAQDKSPSSKGMSAPSARSRGPVPLVRVKPRPAVGDLRGFGAMSGRRGLTRSTSPPGSLSSDARARLLRESGIDVIPVSAPSEFRLSPRQPYVSSSAYLFFNGNTEFNASGDSLLLRIELDVRPPTPQFGILGSGWFSGGPQPDPPGFVGVLVRMDQRSRYLADFSISANSPTTYQLTITGAEGSGSFAREAGGQHVLVAMESDEGGYVQINFSAGQSFTFHNVVVTKLN